MGILKVHTWYIYTQGPECAGLTEKGPRQCVFKKKKVAKVPDKFDNEF